MNSCCNSGAALLGLLLLSACTDAGNPDGKPVGLCQAGTTPIRTIQGGEYHSPLQGSPVTTRGTITWVIPGEGFYVEDAQAPFRGSRSRALFVSDETLSLSANPGQVLTVAGRVAELGSSRDKLTSLVEITGSQVCSENTDLPQTAVDLPINSRTREALEGMRVSIGHPMTVTDVYTLAKGELTLSANGVLRIPTEISLPGRTASRLAVENRNHSLPARLTEAVGSSIPVGSIFEDLTGLMGHDGRGQRLLIKSPPPAGMPAPDQLEPAADGLVRMVSSNLLNFFNGDGDGSGFPTERGAKSHDEFLEQSQRLKAAMTRIRPDLLAVQELENDGFGPTSAARSLLALLNGTGDEDWSFVETDNGRVGNDEIAVGLFYRKSVLEAVGPARVLDRPEFQGLSRQPLVQRFRERRSGVEFLVAANHLKSKGGCPDGGSNSNQGDGQACWNAARVSAVETELEWLESLANEAGTENILVLGDLNAYRKEDPVRTFRQNSFVELVEHISGIPQYSYVYHGRTGTLDYMFASPTLAAYARNARIWHVNADYARNMDHPAPWNRFSDHDPVIVDFDFSQVSTSD